MSVPVKSAERFAGVWQLQDTADVYRTCIPAPAPRDAWFLCHAAVSVALPSVLDRAWFPW